MNKTSNLAILVFTGLIWSTFAIFTKVSAEVLPPFFIAFSRLFIGGIFLFIVAAIQKRQIFRKIFKRENFRHYLIVGIVNSAFPFCLFAIAAKSLDSGVVAILDGTVLMFEVLIVIFILNRAVSANSIWGVFFGILGVIATSLSAEINLDNLRENIFSVILVLFATASYAAASIYINEKCKNIQALDLACGSVFFAALFLLPSVFFVDFTVIDLRIGSSLLGLGLLCTGIAYLFYFKLAAQESPRFAVSVFLLIPVFGAILGVLFMDEAFTLNKIIGCVMILISIKFILNLSLKSFLKEKFVIEARKNLEELPK